MNSAKLIGLSVLFVLILALLLWPAPKDLKRYQDIYARGQYEAVYSQLDRLLMEKPDWHEARELLVLAAVKGGKTNMAIEHMAELHRAGLKLVVLEREMDSWLNKNIPSPGDIEAIKSQAEMNSQWPWLKEFYLGVLVKAARVEEIPSAMVALVNQAQRSSSRDELLDRAWVLVVSSSDNQALWGLARELDRDAAWDMSSWRVRALWQWEGTEELTEIRKIYPGDGILSAELAWRLPTEEGLKIMRQWEAENSQDFNGVEYYCMVKEFILLAAGSIEKADLGAVAPSQLLRIAFYSIDRPEKCRVIIDYLEEMDEYHQLVADLRAAMKGPKPVMKIREYTGILSPDGKWLAVPGGVVIVRASKLGEPVRRYIPQVIDRSNPGAIYNLKNNTKVSLDISENSLLLTWLWSPDSSKIALHDSLGSIRIYDTKGVLRHQCSLVAGSVIGWNDNRTIWVRSMIPSLSSSALALLDIETGTLSYPDVPVTANLLLSVTPGPKGYLAWNDKWRVTMLRKEEILELNAPNTNVLSWIPDGSGLLLEKDNNLSLWAGGELSPLGIQGVFLGWRNEAEFYWAEQIGEDIFPSKLRGYSILTGVIRDYQLFGEWQTAAGKTAISWDGQLAVYLLP